VIINMKEKANLEKLSKEELVEIPIFIDALSERFRRITETIREINYRTDRFIRDFYKKEKGIVSNEYSGRD